jgi:uncharacterized protein (DUF2461 family)
MKQSARQPKNASFEGFSPALFGFLWDLSENNSKDWFDAHRRIYTAEVLRPIKALVGEIGGILGSLNEDMEVEPRIGRTVSRINNDTRFHKHRPPYRPYIYLGFPRRGAKWSSGSLLCVGIFPQGVSVGFYSGGRAKLPGHAIQETIKQNPRVFQKYLDQRRIPERYFELAGKEGQATKWPLPKPARRWVTLESFTIGEHFDSSDPILGRRAFVDRAREILLDLYPLWLFSQSADLERDLQLYNESIPRLTERPVASSE